MSSITVEVFERVVKAYFEPIAREHGWRLVRRSAHLYEVPAPHFFLRIRFGVGGHRKSIYATLIPTEQLPGDIENGGQGELGIAVVAGYNGIPIESIQWDWDQTEQGMADEAQYVAGMVKTHGVPYLLGQKTDWDKVKDYITRENEKTIDRIKGYRFPSFVQKRWHLPPRKQDPE